MAEKVVDALGVSNDDAVRKLLKKAKEVEDDIVDNTAKWPYGIGDVLQKITEAEPILLSDGRLIELRRRWNAR